MILNTLLFSFLFDWYYKMVSPQNGDTRGNPPPSPPLATPRRKPLSRGATAIQQDENLFVRLSFVFLAKSSPILKTKPYIFGLQVSTFRFRGRDRQYADFQPDFCLLSCM